MVTCDIPAAVAIERTRFDHPWNKKDFAAALKCELTQCFVAERDENVVGFVVAHKRSRRIEIESICVALDAARQGVGSLMVDRIKAMLGESGHRSITLAVIETNTTAQKFFRKHGFRVTEIRKDYWGPEHEAAYIMVYIYDPEDCSRAIKAVCDTVVPTGAV